MKTHIIYVPGILDDIGHVQGILVKLWRFWGVKSYTHSMPWVGKADYANKQKRLVALIENLSVRGGSVYLVGSSAGASAVLNAYIDNKSLISGICLICPKVNNANNVGSKISKENPSFIQSLKILDANLKRLDAEDKRKVVSFISPRDGLVPYRDSTIPGVTEHKLPPLRHNAAILYAISFGFAKIQSALQKIERTA